MLAEYIQLPKAGDTVGPFLLRELVSAGILGNFYMATDRVTHETALLHILPEALLRVDGRFHQRYREMVERQSRLPAGTVLVPRNLFRHAGNLVVQYPEGNYRSLGQVVSEAAGTVPEQQVREWLAALGKGLAEAVKLDQGHYFLTPDFLFLGADGRMRVAGVGLFQSIQYEAFERFVSGAVIPIVADQHKGFSVLETLSPEIRNFKTPDPRSDFYGLGMCAYFMLTGRQPERRWSLPSKTRKGLGEGWDLFISRCLEPRPVDRFPNYRAFLHDLEHLEELDREPGLKPVRARRTLSRVPLPSALERRLGLRALMLLRLIILGLAGVLAVGAASLFLNILFTDEGQEDSRPIRLAREPAQANLILEIKAPAAQVRISGPESGRFQVRGQPLLLHGAKGVYQVEVTAPRRQPVSFTVELSARERVVRQVRLEPHFVSVRVKGEPGTEVHVEEGPGLLLYLGRIEEPEGLLVENRLLRGTHRLVGLHPWFLPARPAPVVLERGTPIVQLVQEARPTRLEVLSEPPGAAVYLDQTLIGVTPLRYEGVASGYPFQLRVEKQGYRPYLQELAFGRGQAITVDTGPLEPRLGWLNLQLDLARPHVPPPEQLVLHVDGKPVPVQPRQQLELLTGPHHITLEHPDFFPFSRTVEVLDGGLTEVTLTLEPRPARVRLQIGVPNPARFTVNDRETTLTPEGDLLVPADGPAKVEVSVRDFMTVIKHFVAEPNAALVWEVPLKPLPGPVFGEPWQPPYFDLPMVWIQPGTFVMGSPVTEHRRLPNEDARTTVRFSDGFWIGAKEVTQAVYARIMGDNPSQFKGDDLPVDSVSWEMAGEFCRRLNQFEQRAGRLPPGYSYRLHTEAEWEYAARAGTDTPFSFGTTATPEQGNFLGAYRAEAPPRLAAERYGTLPAGSFPPNPWGLYDVHGNLAEWTLDQYWDRHPGGVRHHPVNSARGRGHTVRGGSWQDGAERTRSAAREGVSPSVRRDTIGFRLVLAPDPLETLR